MTGAPTEPAVKPKRIPKPQGVKGSHGLRWAADQGLWIATVETGRDPVTGDRIRRRVSAKKKADVLTKLDELRQEVAGGAVAGGASTTVGEFLDRWLETVVVNRVDHVASANYEQVVRLHIKPALGKVMLSKLSPEMVDKWLAAKAKSGQLGVLDADIRAGKRAAASEVDDADLDAVKERRRLIARGKQSERRKAKLIEAGDVGLSKSYVGRMRSILTDALNHAEARGIVSRNAGRLSVMPKIAAADERQSLTADDARALLIAAKGTDDQPERLDALVATGLMLGLRPGELTGLLWADLHLDAKPPTLTLSGAMRTQPDGSVQRGRLKKSTAGDGRTVALPMDLADRLSAHLDRQGAERKTAGDMWAEYGLIFCSEVGTPLDASNVRRTFARIAKRAGIGDGGAFPYTMRHTCASLLIDAGVPLEQVADLLGDDPRTVLKHYRHKVRPVADAAAGPMQALFGAS